MDGSKAIERGGPVVVALGCGSSAELVLAQGKALAEARGLRLACVTVDDGGILPERARERLGSLREGARADGAEIVRLPGVDVASAVADYAEANDASAVVVGSGRRRLSRRGTAARLLGMRRGFELVVASPPGGGAASAASPRGLQMGGSLEHYALALAVVACVTGANLLLASYAGYWAAAILYLAAISLVALWLEPGPVLSAALASAVAWDYLFIPPRFTLSIDRPEDDLMLALYILVSLSSGLMTSRLRSSERLLREQGENLARLNSLATALAGTLSKELILSRGLDAIKASIDCEAIAILREAGGELKREPENGWIALDGDARLAAKRCLEEGGGTGRYTRVSASSEWHFVPIEAPQGRLGVIGVRRAHEADWDDSLEHYLATAVATIAVALSRA